MHFLQLLPQLIFSVFLFGQFLVFKLGGAVALLIPGQRLVVLL